MSAPSTESVWAQLSADLLRFIRRRVPDDHVADDLLQETFVRIHRNIANLQDADRLAAWVYQIARHVIYDHHRSSSKSVPLVYEIATVEDRTGNGIPWTATWLAKMVGQLPDSYSDAVQLAELGGLTQQEVAERLGLSLSGAKSRIQRGRAMLKAALLRCCDFELDRRGNVLDCIPKSDRTACLDCDDT
ncbi:MAG: RNA polymerase sigma factor SigZ [Gemmataceae bacterium]|nr:RNA polymerase sigma factor SigZ [Gemmataceae bacterium]MCI0741667.1 RNA polymerase sigma factor SigZ [Gemmataceae bacterium]